MNKKLQQLLKKNSIKSPSLREGFRMGLILFLSIGMYTAIFAQTQQKNFINYQGVASDAAGTVIAEQSITVGIVLRYATTGAAEYAENHAITTDANGVFSLKIGNGTATTSTFDNFQWGDGIGIASFVTVSINGTEIDTTELLGVPYAVTSGDNRWSQVGNDIENLNTGTVKVNSNLEVGANIQLQLGPAANEISIDGTLAGNSDKAIPTEKAVKTYVTNNGATGLEKITEGSNTGWRLIGAAPANYGPIGSNAVDLSYSSIGGVQGGALGKNSFASGGITSAKGDYSTAMGLGTIATRSSSVVIGKYNIENPTAIFSVGIGNAVNVRRTALTILEDGKVGIGRHTPTSLFEVAHQDGTPSSTNRTNAFSIRNLGTGRSWQFYTHSTGFLELYNDGAHKGSFNPTSGAYNVVSDRRVKKDITPLISGTLQKVMKLNPVSYLMIDQKNSKRNLGLISQEVKEIFPSITHYVKEQDLLTLSYTELIPVLIKALQEQQTIIAGQNTKINGLSAEVGQIKTMLKKLSLTNSIAVKE